MKIAIIGGGVSGLTAGCLLAEAGCAVRIYERKNRVGKNYWPRETAAPM
ncbi:NAD(P)-binding protein [Aedoeadaptatus coli]|nr:NAD(P)-binding protein [Peptoniphilus coli]